MHSSCDLGLRVFTPLGGIGVSLFLIMSGYGLEESFKRKGIDGFWINKFYKIWIPYAIVLTFTKFSTFSFDVHTIMHYCCIDSPFWYISFLFYNYLLFYVCHKFEVLQKYRFLIFFTFAIILFFFDTRIRAEQSFSFVTGMLLSTNKKTFCSWLSRKRLAWTIISLLYAISMSALLAKQMPVVRVQIEHVRLFQNFMDLAIKFPFAIATAFVLAARFSFIRNGKRGILNGNRFCGFCSKISLELYIIHFSLRWILTENLGQIVSVIIFIGFSFVLSILLYKFKNSILTWKK